MRRSKPEVIDVETVDRTSWARRLLILLLLLIVAGGAIWVMLRKIGETTRRPTRVAAAEVRSDVVQRGDSLEVAVGWEFAGAASAAESVRVEVGLGDGDIAQVSTVPAATASDTTLVPAPEAGQTATGYSCVAPIQQGKLGPEKCTPWQFVRPAAEQAADTARGAAGKAGRRARAAGVKSIVVQPGGVQVDPDVDGRCAAWQRQNPGRSVWIEINRKAVAQCTGPNGKPTVAQFCAFAILTDGRRVKTAASDGLPYCERLFRDWSREMISGRALPACPAYAS